VGCHPSDPRPEPAGAGQYHPRPGAFLLKGIVQGVDGRALALWFTRKKSGRLYRYYLPVRDNKEHAGASGLPRLLSAELEAAVLRAAAPAAVCPGDGRQCGRACPSENWWMN
jgi:site-specific DNA recombinase